MSQGSFCVCVQPMRDDVTLTGRIHKMIPDTPTIQVGLNFILGFPSDVEVHPLVNHPQNTVIILVGFLFWPTLRV